MNKASVEVITLWQAMGELRARGRIRQERAMETLCGLALESSREHVAVTARRALRGYYGFDALPGRQPSVFDTLKATAAARPPKKRRSKRGAAAPRAARAATQPGDLGRAPPQRAAGHAGHHAPQPPVAWPAAGGSSI